MLTHFPALVMLAGSFDSLADAWRYVGWAITFALWADMWKTS